MPIQSTFAAASIRGFGGGGGGVSGAQLYTTPGTYTFTVPAGITSISILAVGGGGGATERSLGGGGGGLRYYTS